MATIRQIAEHCGVSVSTVSKALNGAEDVSQATVRRIRQAADEMGYMPNAAARALKTRRSFSFGVLFAAASEQGLTHEFFSRILNSFKTRAGELGYDICFISDHLGKRRIGYAEHARYRNVDGVLIVVGTDRDEDSVRELAGAGIPIVCIDSVYSGCGSVLSDNDQGMTALLEHVIALGHRRIAFIHGENSFVTRSRVAAFRRVCAEKGLTIPEDYIVEGLYHKPEYAQLLTRRLLALPEPPKCILYPDDIAILGGLQELEAAGLSVPRDMSAAGYDGTVIGQAYHPRLTTLRQNAEAMGSCAAEELARAVEAGEHYDCRRVLIPGTLIEGETVRRLDS